MVVLRIIRSGTTPSRGEEVEMPGMPTQLVRQVLRSSERLRRCLQLSYTQSELNGPRVEALEAIAIAGPEGCSQTELAAQLGAAESSVSTIVERMRRDGLVLRMRSRLDRRCSVLLLTEVGCERLEAVAASRDRHLAQWIDQLSMKDQQQLSQLLDRLLVILAQAPLSRSIVESDASPKWGEAA